MARLPLQDRNGNVVAWALIDDVDFGWLQRWEWRLSSKGYAERGEWNGGRQRKVLMHRVILRLTHDDRRFGEHRNKNRLDNRRENLRVVDGRVENNQNTSAHSGSTSRFRGVSRRGSGRFAARVKLHGKDRHIGTFDTEEEAAAVAAAFRKEHMPYSHDDQEAASVR